MNILQFIKKFWNRETVKNIAKADVPGIYIPVEKPPYEFNEFEKFFIEAMESDRYSSIERLLEKGFQVKPELREKIYERFWLNFVNMTMQNSIFKEASLSGESFEDLMKFLVKNDLFELDFFDFIEKSDFHIRDEFRETYSFFKNSINKYEKIAIKHNNETKKISFLKNNQIELMGLKETLPVLTESKISHSILDVYSDNFVKAIYGVVNIKNSDDYNLYLTNRTTSIYNMSLSFSVASLYQNQHKLDDGTFSNLKLLQNPLVEIPYLDFLNLERQQDLKDIHVEKIQKLSSDFHKSYTNDYRLGSNERVERFGKNMSHILHSGVVKKEFLSTLFFPYLMKSLINKGTSPIELFKIVSKKGSSISDLGVLLFQEYPNEIINGISNKEVTILSEKLNILMLEMEKSSKSLSSYASFNENLEENTFIYDCLKRDIKKVIEYIYKKDEDSILEKYDLIKSREVESSGDFIAFAKLKDFPRVIIDRLEYIKQKLSTLHKYDLDVENKHFIHNSPNQIMKIMNDYLNLEEVTENITKDNIESILIHPIIELDNLLDDILKSYQEEKMKELSVKNKIARSKL